MAPDTDVAEAPLVVALVLISAATMAASGLVALLAGRSGKAADRLFAVLMVIGALLGLAAAALGVAAPSTPLLIHSWTLPWGRFAVALDTLSAAFLLPVLVLPTLAAVYGVGYFCELEHPATAPRARVFLGAVAAGMILLVIARDAVLFLFGFEIMALSAFFLVTTEDQHEPVRAAGWVYLVAAHVSLMFLFAAFALLSFGSGSFDLGPDSGRALAPGMRSAVFLLALLGFGIKAGIMPLHVWLPGAHANAPSHVSAVLSGVVLKTGIYGLARVSAMLPDPPLFWGLLLLVLGGASGVVGVAYAIGQHDLKRLLAYHSIENIGIIVMGLGLALLGRWAHRSELIVLGFACAIMHVWNHALFKSLLFLSAGAVVHATGTREIDRLGGLHRLLPFTALMFLLGSVAICGLPPLNGFISELFLYSAALRSLLGGGGAIGALAAPTLAIIGALACACFVKVVGAVFLGSARSDAALRAHECSWWMRVPMLLLALPCVVLGIAAAIAAPLIDATVRTWAGAPPATLPSLASLVPFRPLAIGVTAVLLLAVLLSVALIVRARRARPAADVGTWDCGFARPTSRMQYTASSFASVLVNLFAFALKPAEHGPAVQGALPSTGAYASHVDDATLARMVLPFASWVADRFARLRQQQSGRIQIYILYVALATIAMLLSVVPAFDLLWSLISQ
ncbi:MAG: proton-conducting transporter membrane subunit [Planctomycetota bacterium]